jgi:hypothetical protein
MGDGSPREASDMPNCAGRGLPLVGIHITMHEARPKFHFNFDCEKNTLVQVDDISITNPGSDGTQFGVVCLLRSRRGAKMGDFPDDSWTYGEPMPGYLVTGPCAPLQRGQVYEVDVDAGGVGYATFSNENDGTVRVHEEGCNKRAARKCLA